MFNESAPVRKRALTLRPRALVVTFLRVCRVVRVQIAERCKRETTVGSRTREGAHGGVLADDMFQQDVGVAERFVAVRMRTLELFLFLVHVFNVDAQLGLVVEKFLARRTRVRRLLLVNATYVRTRVRRG